MDVFKFLVFLSLTISHASTSTSLSTPTTSTSASTSTATDGSCESFTDTDDIVFISCLTGLYSLNLTGALSIDQGCRYYNHVLKCISNKLNGTCGVTYLHKHVPDYIRSKPGIRQQFFKECTVSDLLESDGFCNDSAAFLISGISVCVPQEIPSSCDYIGSVFLKCYNKYGIDDYFQCSKREMRQAFEDETDWFLENWKLNMSLCWNGDNIIVDICSTPMLQNNISMSRCRFLVYNFDIRNIMSNKDMCRQYTYYLKCIEGLFEKFNTDGNYKCSLESLHKWVPSYFKAHMNIYGGIAFNATLCNISEFATMDYCSDRRAVFLTEVNLCTLNSGEIFECGYIRTLVENCDQSWDYYYRPTNMTCTIRQRELAMESEAEYFKTKHSINVTNCSQDGVKYGQEICNKNVSDRDIIYSEFYNCFQNMGVYNYFNRSGLLTLSEGCRIYNYAMHCVKKGLERNSGYDGCDIHSIEKWFQGEYYTKSTMEILVPNCNVTSTINESFCKDSLAMFYGMVGFCYDSIHLKSLQTYGKKDICSAANALLQSCYYHKWDIVSQFGCTFADRESAIVNNAIVLNTRYGTDINMSSCFKGCLSSRSCYKRGSSTNWEVYASFNSSKCSCSYYCHGGYDNCCPDFYDGCVCTSDIWSYIDKDDCKYLISNFNKTETMNEDDVCRTYSYYLKCVQTQSRCPLEQLESLLSDYIRQNHNSLYRFNTSRCNVSMASSLSDFCSDERTLFQVGVNRECTKPRENEFFTCGYLDNKAHNCYNWYWASSLISCNHIQRKNALLENSDWFYKTWNINISVCKEESVKICTAAPSMARNALYSRATLCFEDFHIWFNRSGLANSSDGCSFYMQILQCMKNGFGWTKPYKPCADQNLHDFLIQHVIQSTKIYDIIHSCNVSTSIDKTFCEDEEAKLAYLLGVCRRTPTILHGRILKNQSNICQILNSILVECHYEVRKPYFQCDFSDLYSPFDPKTGILAKRFNIDISDCFSGCGTSYACCTDGISSGYCIASFNGTECSCNDTCVDQQNCCTDFLEACHNISSVHPGVQTNDSQPRTPGDSFRFGAYEGDTMIFGDDTLSPIVLIPLGFPTENRFFDHLKIGTNGIILFSVERSFNPPTPVNFKQIGGIDFVAPFWTDIYVPEGRSHVYYHVYDKTKIRYIGDYTWYILKEVSEEISHFYKLKYFNAVWALITTWDKVLPPSSSTELEEMTFQCILATNGISSYAIFNYMSMNVTNVEGRQAAMGYRLSNYKMNDLSFNDAAFEINTFKGNVGLNGYYVYKLTNENGNRQNYKQLCYNWYDKYRDEKSTIFDRISMERFNCPCTLHNIRFDWRWMKMRSPTKGVSCFTLFATTLLPATRSCCYNDFYGSYIRIHPTAGSYHMFHPVFAPRSFATEESLPKEYCCLRSNLCNLYYSIREIGNCYGKLPFKYRWFYGDPHIESLDGKQYTFNGIGEYVLMKIVNENVTFELQARTERILKENGTYSNATVFTAFAMKEESTTFQVELTDDRKKLVVFSNEYDYTTYYNQNPDFSVITEHIKLSRQSDTLVVVFGISGLQINITLGIRMLTFSTTVPDEFAGQTVGLVGNFDGDDKNDFILPNGTILTENQTRTERQIFYNFGEHWAINETESVFKYPPGKSPGDYRDRDFIPIFIEDFDQEDVVKAKTVCGNKTSSTACIYDYLLTKDESIGKDSGRVKVEAIETVKSSENKVPVIWGDRSVNATIGIPTKIQVHGEDDGNFSYHVISGPKTNFNMDETKSFYTWTPNDATPVNISITVIDNFGVVATPLDIQVTMCGNCSNHGYCMFNETVPQTTLFEYAKCVCEQGWTGYQCENDVNGCSGLPCSDGRNCTDLTPEEEANFGRSFNCSACPKGYTENDKNKCSDIDECKTESNICTQKCVNSIGSFFCGCETGFTLTDGYKCIDINECDMKNDCEQLCTNTDGGYSCSCLYGYKLNSDSKTCTKQSQEDFCKNLSCSYTCDKNKEGKFHCICPKGFHLLSDERSCEDDDECTNRICQHKCNNTKGGFVCSCHAGFILDTDGFSCKECEIRKWGFNCANYCTCVNGECDPVFGCQCDAGFSGSKCDQDVNECKITGICNDPYKTCFNTYGSYDCRCKDGYYEENKICKNINECDEVLLNLCDEKTTTCLDTIGNFTCVCNPGYIHDSLYKCKDMDECSIGHPCEQICINNEGSYQCQCQNGFSIMDDRSHCKKLSDYEHCQSLNCSYSCTFSNGSYTCFCPSWSELDSDRKTCKDIDECLNNRTNKCSFKDRCNNIERGYTCLCPDGFRLENDGRTCKECSGTGWGSNCKNECNCAPGAVSCDSTKGCVCQIGYNGTHCENDVDECAENPCDKQLEYCENIPGSFRCKCHQGYSKISSKCTNIDECKTNKSNCEQICTDFDGGYNCSCFPGFYLTDNGKCKDIDECQTGRHNCDQICKNTIGSFQCLCNDGYSLNTTTRNSCFVKQICSSPNNCSHLCAVHGGKEKCSCRQGYMLKKNGITCDNINECENVNFCDQICTDLTPGYDCACNPGYYLDMHNGKTCKETSSITLQTTEANELTSKYVKETHSKGKNTIPKNQSIKLQVNLTIDIDITSQTLTENMTFYMDESQKMLENIYNRIENVFIQVIKLSKGSLHILYNVTAYKKQSAEIAIVLLDVVEGKITLKFQNSNTTVKGANIVLSNDLTIVIDPNEDSKQSLCKIYSTLTECSLSDCEVKGGIPKCRETATDSSFTSGLAIGLFSGISLIMFIIILAIVFKFINYKKKIHTSSQDIGMVDTKHIEKNYENKYDPFPQTMDHSTDKSRVGTNDYYSISSGSSWREMLTDGCQSLYSNQFKIQRPAMKSTINNS